ncbi:hypothetical protein N7541_002575 [Penicillium brevicompactum]|uniref:Lysine-specific metallo-endopeptidase domain-containing protein n=1 Tax=Penicillium brevicompactum TaxID=5074 RepID=A0A9W9RKK5_PENBR|nr:hypothetical protein N7541_002575 [Penicillium brevicompactum]
MKTFSVALLVGAASQTLAYNIHSSCDCGDHRDDIKNAMEEAKAVLSWSSLTGTACAMWERTHEAGDEPQSMYETCKDQGRRSILDDFFGDHSATAYEAIANALGPASKVPGDYSESVDDLTIVCGDSHLKKITTGVYRDQNRGYADVRYNPAPGPNQSPCDVVQATAYTALGKNVIMLCNRDYTGVNQQPTFSQLNTRDVRGKSVDFLSKTISSVFTHELIHTGNFDQFPRSLGDGTSEKYEYAGCKELAGGDLKWKNCDTFAIIARIFYLNNYYSKDGTLTALPTRLRPQYPNPAQ